MYLCALKVREFIEKVLEFDIGKSWILKCQNVYEPRFRHLDGIHGMFPIWIGEHLLRLAMMLLYLTVNEEITVSFCLFSLVWDPGIHLALLKPKTEMYNL